MPDFPHYTCPEPGCDTEIHGETVADPGFNERMDAHIRAHAVADRIRADLCNRRGLRQEWDMIEPDIQAEILAEWTRIIERSESGE